MPYAGLFSFVTARSDGARLWRDVLARNHGKPCKYCEFATFHYSFWSVFSPLLRRVSGNQKPYYVPRLYSLSAEETTERRAAFVTYRRWELLQFDRKPERET